MNKDHPRDSTPKQSAKEDATKLAARARKATEGFDINRLFGGRLDQLNYCYGAIASLVIGGLLMYIPIIGMLIAMLIMVIGLGMTARRLRDIGVMGWAALILFVPLIGFLVVLYLCWKKGDEKANQYGPVPDPKREMFHSWLNT